MAIPETVSAIGLGVLSNWATSLISIGFSKFFGEKDNPLLSKVYDAASRTADSFLKEYNYTFGKLDESFLARQENWDAFFECLRFGNPSIDKTKINPKGFKGAPDASEEAVTFFLKSLEEEMRKDQELNNILELKNHIVDGKEMLAKFKTLEEKIDHLNPQKPSIPQRLTNRIPQTSLDKIIGRSTDLTILHQSLFTLKKVVLVYGMGGIGKTTLAKVYVNEYQKKYRHIVWITNISEDIKNDFINAEGLCINLNISKDGKKTEELFSEILSALNSVKSSPNLLVIDDADATLSKYYDYLPSQPKWHILVTSRERIEKFDFQELDFLSIKEAIDLFKMHYTLNNIPEDRIRYLVENFEFNTLAIEIIASSANRQRFNIDTLEHAIEKDLKANVYVEHNGNKIDRITSYLCSIFKLSALNENEIWLLKQFVCLPSDFFEYDFLKNIIKPDYFDKEEIFSETIEELCAKSWLLKDGRNNNYKLHKITSVVIKKSLTINVNDVEPLIAVIGLVLSSEDPPLERLKYTPFGESILNQFENNDELTILKLRNCLALLYKDFGNLIEAKKLFEKNIGIEIKKYGKDNPNTIVSYSNLATVLHDLGDYLQAKAILEWVVIVNENRFGNESPETATSYSNLALVLQSLNELSGAKNYLTNAVKIDEKNFGIEHYRTTLRYSNLATVLEDLGEYTDALQLLKKASKSNENNLGVSHPDTIMSYSNLAILLKKCGEYEEAEVLFRKVIEANERIFGMISPRTATSYYNLAVVLHGRGELKESEDYYKISIEANEKLYGTDHPLTTLAYLGFGGLLKDLGQLEKAKNVFEKCVSLNEKIYGIEHPKTINSYSHLGLLLFDLGEYYESKKIIENVVTLSEKLFGKDHPSLSEAYSNLGYILVFFKDFLKVKELHEKALGINLKKFDSDHPLIAINKSNLAMAYKELKEYKKAEVLLREAILTNEKVYGKESIETGTFYLNLALVLQEIKEYKEAEALFGKAILLQENFFGKKHPKTINSYHCFGILFLKISNFAQSKELLEKALRYATEFYGIRHIKTAEIYFAIAKVFVYTGEFEEAIERFENAINIYINELEQNKIDPVEIALIYNDIAGSFYSQNNCIGAKELYEKAVDFCLKYLGSYHYRTSMHYSNLALCYRDLKDYKKAQIFYEKAVEIDQRNHGSRHINNAVNYLNLGSFLIDINNYTKANKYLNLALSIFKRNAEFNHQKAADIYIYMSKLYDCVGDIRGKIESLKSAILISESVNGLTHQITTNWYYELEKTFFLIENFTELNTLYRKIIFSNVNNFGYLNAITANNYCNLVYVLQKIGEYDHGKYLCREVLKLYTINLGIYHPVINILQRYFKSIYESGGEYNGAYELLDYAFGKVYIKVEPTNK